MDTVQVQSTFKRRFGGPQVEIDPAERTERERARQARAIAARREKRAEARAAQPLPDLRESSSSARLVALHTGRGAHTLTQLAIVEAYRRGYRLTDAGEVRTPTGSYLRRTARRGWRSLGIVMLVPDGLSRARRKPRSGKQVVAVHLGTFAAFCRHGDRAFSPGAQTIYLNGDRSDLSRANALLADHSAVAAMREERARREKRLGRHQWVSWRERVEPLVAIIAAPGSKRRLSYEAVVGYRLRWAGGAGPSIASLAREAGIDPSAMAFALRGVTYRTPLWEGRRKVKRPRGLGEQTIRAFRLAVQEHGISVEDAAKRLGRTMRWGYLVMQGKLYPPLSPVTATSGLIR